MISESMPGAPTPKQSPDPWWQPTDWTPRQRWLALGGLFLLALAYGLLSAALLLGSLGSRAVTLAVPPTLRPLGLTLLCLGTTLLTAAFWYAHRHAANHSGSGGRASAATGLLALEGGVALVTLVVWLVCTLAVITGGNAWVRLFALLAPRGAWTALPHSVAASAVGICLLCSFLLGASLVNPGNHAWRPQRAPLARGSALGPLVTGWRWGLRRIVAGMGENSLLLLLIPLCLLDWFGIQTPQPVAIALLGVAALFCLVALAAEATRPAHPTTVSVSLTPTAG